ncbi:MAG: hypothetical protein ACRDG7_06685 [Candidatus Limnocylindria bacterium]
MTGATGNLTPDDSDMPFVPAESREVSDPDDQARVTATQGRHAPAQSGDIGEPGVERSEGGLTDMATRESGYGSEHGLSPNDPAYRMESRPVTVSKDDPQPSQDRENRIGGDEISDHDEHF